MGPSVASHPGFCDASFAAHDFVPIGNTNALESNTRIDPTICLLFPVRWSSFK